MSDNITTPNEQIIYIVLACLSYEGCDAVKAFELKRDADKFCAECNDYTDTPVEPLNADVQDENFDVEFEAWNIKHHAWVKKHPASSHAHADRFHVQELVLVAANTEVSRT